MSMPMRRTVLIVVAAVAGILGWGCRDDSITQPETNASDVDDLIVSSPTLLASANGVGDAAASQESLAFVSLVPGTAPSGVSATIRNSRKGVTETVAVVDGGFDPVAIRGSVGDTIAVAVTDAAGVVVFQAVAAIRSPRRPVVVRTNPPAKKTDIPLNLTLQVVFSAPMDSTTLNTGSIQLMRGTLAVPGRIRFTDSTYTVAEFQPYNLLDAVTSYRFLISQTIRDVNHMALESRVELKFSTGTNALDNAKLVFTVQPTNTTAGAAISPPIVVAVQDAAGKPIPYANGPVTIGWASGFDTRTFLGTSTVNAVNGVATFDDLSIMQAAAVNVLKASYVAAYPVLTSAPSSAFSVAPAAASKLVVSGPSSIDATRQFAVDVHASDPFGNYVPSTPTNSVTVSLGSNPGGATLDGTLTLPMVGGAVTFANLTLDRAGIGYVLRVISAAGGGGTLSGTMKLDVWNRDAFTAVSAGGAHTCALTREGYTYCWGANKNGQVGAGTTIDYASPVIVASGMNTVRAGGNHTCANTITAATLTYCWGLNDDGQLGDGTRTTRLVPTAVASNTIGSGVMTGGSHTCASWETAEWDVPLKSTCWGSNSHGQLGEGLIALSAGGSHTCGRQETGFPELYCWGSNKNGQLGAGPLTEYTPHAVRVARFVENGTVSAGGSHTCASIVVVTSGLWCWGLNDSGQLGDGTTIQRTSPVLVSGGPFSSVTAGGSHTCALTSAGAAYCWGANDHGQVGDGTTTMRTSPVLVAGGLNFVSISAGGSHTCGVTVVGTYCWGANGNGQLGSGTTTDSAVPVKVSGH